MKTAKVISVLLFSLASFPLVAQFTIRESPEIELPAPASKEPEIQPVAPYKFDYLNDTERILQRRARRKERNTLTLTTTLNVTQTNFDNWAKGGDNTLAISGSIDFRHVYKVDRFSNTTRLNANYGFSYIEKLRYKNKDNFLLQITPGWTIHKYWSYAGDVRLNSQFDKGYKNQHKDNEKLTSNFMAPGTLNISGGVKFRKDSWEILASPIGGQAIFVLDKELSDAGTVNNVEKGKRSKWSAGPSLKIIFEKEFGAKFLKQEFPHKLFYFKSDLYGFSDVKFNSDPTFDWNAKFEVRPVKWLKISLEAWSIYNRAVATEEQKVFQWRYTYTVGLTYTFKNK